MDHYVGLDVSLADTSICVIDQSGLIVHEAKAPSDPSSTAACLRVGRTHGVRPPLANPIEAWPGSSNSIPAIDRLN